MEYAMGLKNVQYAISNDTAVRLLDFVEHPNPNERGCWRVDAARARHRSTPSDARRSRDSLARRNASI